MIYFLVTQSHFTHALVAWRNVGITELNKLETVQEELLKIKFKEPMSCHSNGASRDGSVFFSSN